MVDMVLSVMQSFRTTVDREHKEEVFTRRRTADARFEKMLDAVETETFNLQNEIRALLDHRTMSDVRKLDSIRAVLDRDRESVVDMLRADIRNSAAAAESLFHDILENRSIRLQNRISPILKQVKLIGDAGATDLMAAIAHFRERDGSIGPGMPLEFLTSAERGAVNDPKGFRVSLCKVFLFRHVAAAIKAGSLNLDGSCKYRPLDDYLTDFDDPDPVLQELEAVLQQQYETTNRAAKDDSNPYLKVREPGNFRVTTPALDEVESEPLQEILPKRDLVPLSEVLATVDRHCGMFGEFRHWQQANVGQTHSTATTIAGIMGLGCAIGIRKMARISREVGERELEHAVNWRFSLDNVRAANDAVAGVMDGMEPPNLHRRERERLHTAGDGQKFEVRGESLHASRSFKYFGQGRGAGACTFVDERHLLWHSLTVSAADRESACAIDELMRNDVVKSDIHSTDTHGYTEAVFGLTHLLGFSFAPRIKSIGNRTLYIFRPKRRADASWCIKPDKTVNDTLIRDNWDDLLRLAATIKLKENTASDIFRRLNSYSRQHALYRTLKSFGQIIKSLFILRYVDDLELRRAIERQLNKVELANRFTRAVAVGSPREFTQAEKEEQEIAEACNRLTGNSIICWNYLYLTRQIEKAGDEEAREGLRRTIAAHSPMSWAHVNMLGEYDFSDEKLKDSIGILPPKPAA